MAPVFSLGNERLATLLQIPIASANSLVEITLFIFGIFHAKLDSNLMALAVISLVVPRKGRANCIYWKAVLVGPSFDRHTLCPKVSLYLLCRHCHLLPPVCSYKIQTQDAQASTQNSKKPETVSRRLRFLRGKETQEAFSKRVGISRSALANYETGRSVPNSFVLNQISEKCGVAEDFFSASDLVEKPADLFRVSLICWFLARI